MLAALLLVVLLLAQVALADIHVREARALPDQRRSRSLFAKYRRQNGECIQSCLDTSCIVRVCVCVLTSTQVQETLGLRRMPHLRPRPKQ